MPGIEQAIERIREIQADLEAGRLTVPYPEQTSRELLDLGSLFSEHCKTSDQARDLVARIHGPAKRQAALPW